MSFHQVAIFFLIMGCAALVIGLADIAVTVIGRRAHKVRNIAAGAAFIVLGILIIWLSQQRTASYHIDLGPYDIFGVLLVGFVFGMFILRFFMNIREAQARLQEPNLSRFTIWRSTFQGIGGLIGVVLSVFILLLFFSQLLR